MAQRTVLKVDLSCQKCKTKLLKAVTAIEGVDKIEVEATKGTVNVTGHADPYKIIVCARKAVCKHVDVVSVGPPPPPPPPPPQKQKDKKDADDQKKKKKKGDEMVHDCYTCRCQECQRFVLVQLDHGCNEPSPLCSVM